MDYLQGRGCTYSFCGKYESCADCVTDPSCGWCDSLRSCLGGVAEGPPKIECPDWFYYHCYTVEDGECSWQIMVSGKEGKRREKKENTSTLWLFFRASVEYIRKLLQDIKVFCASYLFSVDARRPT